jgi:SAM-dependent methyltransferase
MTRRLAEETGASAVGVDINVHGIEAANAAVSRDGASSRVSYEVVDAGTQLPFADASFDAIFCNDAINHLSRRAGLFADWYRVLKPGGRLLFTDPIVVTGPVSNLRAGTRSSSKGLVSSSRKFATSPRLLPRYPRGGGTRAPAGARRSSRSRENRDLTACNGSSTLFARFHAKNVCRGWPTWLAK